MKENDYAPETKSLLERLIGAGFTIHHGDNGADEFRLNTTGLDEFVNDLTATDEARVFVRLGNRHLWLYLVLGNEPGVLVSDYSVSDALDAVVDAHYAAWEHRPQPTKPGPAWTDDISYLRRQGDWADNEQR